MAKAIQRCIQEGKLTDDSFLFRYLTDVTNYTLQSNNNSKDDQFQWHKEVVEFFHTIKYLGGQKTYNFVRGPGFDGKGRGGTKKVESLSIFNLPGPSLHALRRCNAGYTTEGGVITSHLKSFHQLAIQPESQLSPLITSDIVHVIPCNVSSDGTALKPGLEYDSVKEMVVGSTDKIDIEYIRNNPEPAIKNKILVDADVSFLVSLANKLSLPVAVQYLPKAVTGQQMRDRLSEMILSMQTCESCLSACQISDNVLDNQSCINTCNSFCEMCWQSQAVCPECKITGQLSHFPALRACDLCLESQTRCNKVAIFSIVTDCEEKNKKAMETWAGVLNNPYLSLSTMIPDAVHLGKSLKCSWANWFLILGGSRSNLVFLRTLRDSAEDDISRPLRRELTLDCVRNKDRMAVEPIVKLSHPNVIQALDKVEYVVHTLVPERYRFWKSNQPGTYTLHTAICMGPLGKVLFIDYATNKLVQLRLHYPSDLNVLCQVDDQVQPYQSLCYSAGVVYVATIRNIFFHDMANKVVMKVSKLKSKAALVAECAKRNLSSDGNVRDLRQRLNNHLDRLRRENHNGTSIVLSQPIRCTTVCCVDDVLFCTDDSTCTVYQIDLSFNGVGVAGMVQELTTYHNNPTRGIAVNVDDIYFSNSNGIYHYNKITNEQTQVLNQAGINGMCITPQQVIAYCNDEQHQVEVLHLDGLEVRPLAGGRPGSQDGSSVSARFYKPNCICVEGGSFFVTDSCGSRVVVISDLNGTKQFLRGLGSLYQAFGIRAQGMQKLAVTSSQCSVLMTEVRDFVNEHAQQARESQGLSEFQVTNGPQGTVSSKTQKSTSLLLNGIVNIFNKVTDLGYPIEVNPSALLTTMVENLHAVSHLRHETFSTLEYAHDFGLIFRESMKRVATWSVKYFTSSKSYYPVPESNIKVTEVQAMVPTTTRPLLTQ